MHAPVLDFYPALYTTDPRRCASPAPFTLLGRGVVVLLDVCWSARLIHPEAGLMPAVRLHDDPCCKGLILRCRPQIRPVHGPIHQQLLHQLRRHLHTELGEIGVIPPQLEATVVAAESTTAPGFHMPETTDYASRLP